MTEAAVVRLHSCWQRSHIWWFCFGSKMGGHGLTFTTARRLRRQFDISQGALAERMTETETGPPWAQQHVAVLETHLDRTAVPEEWRVALRELIAEREG